MKWFYNLKIGTKLLINVGLAILVAVLLSVIGYYQMSNLGRLQDSGYIRFQDAIVASDSSFIGNRLYNIAADSVINRNMDDSAQKWRIEKENCLAEIEKVISLADTDEEEKAGSEAKAALDEFISIYETKMLPLLKLSAGITDEIRALDGQMDEQVSKMNASLKQISESFLGEAQEADDEFGISHKNSIIMNIIISIAASAVLILLSLWIMGSIVNPLKKLTAAADMLASGDLNINLDIKTKDETGELSQAFDVMADNINQILTQIDSAAEQVTSGARQVSESSQTLSQGSTEQASSVEEITSSVTQIASQTKQNAISANQANELAASAKDSALKGNSQMKDMLKSMEDINESSSNISKIIKVIDEIAFQTNILALNAAVEAARAGQHGKGFAVVAEEVRNLAARSANAAKETTAMIEGSIKKAEAGTSTANHTAEALKGIVDSVAKVSKLVEDIAAASNEQATGIAQVNEAIEQVSQVTQTNSATAEEGAAASQQLTGQAEMLRSMISKFKLKNLNSPLDSFNGLRPDILRILEGMSERKNSFDAVGPIGRGTGAASHPTKVKIHLGDREFGKY